MTGHGIPQGPIASNFLAEAFLLPIDVRLQKEEFQYLRYVDDIRLFGRTEGEVRQAAIILEQECRDRGLIPQSTKFKIRKIKSPEDAMGALPSIPPKDNHDASEPIMTAEEAISILYTSIGGKLKKVTDKARFRYVMYRAPQDTKFLNIVLKLMPRHPEHIDAFVAYFEILPHSVLLLRQYLITWKQTFLIPTFVENYGTLLRDSLDAKNCSAVFQRQRRTLGVDHVAWPCLGASCTFSCGAKRKSFYFSVDDLKLNIHLAEAFLRQYSATGNYLKKAMLLRY